MVGYVDARNYQKRKPDLGLAGSIKGFLDREYFSQNA